MILTHQTFVANLHPLRVELRCKLQKTLHRLTGSALDHIEITYHDVTAIPMPEFKSLEVLEKTIFVIILLYINPNSNHNKILTLTIKKKL